MTDQSLTFALDGNVSLDALHEAITELRALVWALTQEVAPGVAIAWSVADLSGGSASGSSESPRSQKPLCG